MFFSDFHHNCNTSFVRYFRGFSYCGSARILLLWHSQLIAHGRLRRTEAMRSFVRETRLTPEGFVYPLFVCPGEGIRKEVRSMPGVYNLSIDEAVKEVRRVKSLGIPSVILFGCRKRRTKSPPKRGPEDGIVQRPPAPSSARCPDCC